MLLSFSQTVGGNNQTSNFDCDWRNWQRENNTDSPVHLHSWTEHRWNDCSHSGILLCKCKNCISFTNLHQQMQPRRVAAITLATRVAQEMSAQLGTTVGYTVRFEDIPYSPITFQYVVIYSIVFVCSHFRTCKANTLY